MMVPGRTSCPGSGWTREYYGYLMTTSSVRESQTDYLCVDKFAEPLPGAYQSSTETGGHVGHVKANCIKGNGEVHNCPEYASGREVACVVCTK